MNGDLVANIHLVKFINGTNAAPILELRVSDIVEKGKDSGKVSQLTASIKAPASIVNSPVSGSLTTEAVKPAAEDAFPLVYTARGFNEQIYLS